jgi:hypothetical protein
MLRHLFLLSIMFLYLPMINSLQAQGNTYNQKLSEVTRDNTLVDSYAHGLTLPVI